MTDERLRRVLRHPTSSYRLQLAVSPLLRGRRWGVRSKRIAGKQYLDIGPGPRTKPNFINLDYHWRPGVDICWDATKPIPLSSLSLKGVFSEHCIEHLPLAGADHLYGEVFRLLGPGGTLRIIVPDGEFYARRYVDLKDGNTTARFPHDEADEFHGIRTPMMSVNRIFYLWEHRFIYDFETLRSLLEWHGFTDVRLESYRNGRDPAMLNDDEFHIEESLYVEATRPA